MEFSLARSLISPNSWTIPNLGLEGSTVRQEVHSKTVRPEKDRLLLLWMVIIWARGRLPHKYSTVMVCPLDLKVLKTLPWHSIDAQNTEHLIVPPPCLRGRKKDRKGQKHPEWNRSEEDRRDTKVSPDELEVYQLENLILYHLLAIFFFFLNNGLSLYILI
jgi:hypothetical protein